MQTLTKILIPILIIFMLVGCFPAAGDQITPDNGTQNMPNSEENTSKEPKAHPLIIAHRGARSLAPENTIAAARKALEIGADLWELDVAVTSDNELIVVHDDTLNRTCNVAEKFPKRIPWNVWEFTLEEVKTLDCGTWFINTDPFEQIKKGNVTEAEANSYRGEKIPTLREAIQFTHDNQWRVNIELKDQVLDKFDNVIVEKTVALVEEFGMDDGKQVVISSFNHDYLKVVSAINPNIPVQVLTSEKIDNLSEYLEGFGTDSCNPRVTVWNKGELEKYSQAGIKFFIWTVNDPAKMKELIDVPVAGIFTDYPQVLKELLIP